MNFERFDVVNVNENNFIVLNKITYDDKTYLYLINEDEENDECAVVKVDKQDNDTYIFSEVTNEELDIVLGKIIIENKEEIKEIYNNKNQ